MSYLSIYKAMNDQTLRDRIVACVLKEADNNTDPSVLGGQTFRNRVIADPAQVLTGPFAWRIAVRFETDYENAMTANNPDPQSVITDANIRNTVRSTWPQG